MIFNDSFIIIEINYIQMRKIFNYAAALVMLLAFTQCKKGGPDTVNTTIAAAKLAGPADHTPINFKSVKQCCGYF
jgi:hypothetical protein